MPSQQSPFETLERAFQALCEEPCNVALDGRPLGWPFPPRPIPLTELRSRLLHPSTPHEARDRAIAAVARRAKANGGSWSVALAGLLLPALRAIVGPVTRAWPSEASEVEGDTLAGLLAALADFHDDERCAARLAWRAAGPVRRRAARELPELARRSTVPLAAAPRVPWGHPDFVLAQAVKSGALTQDDANLIAATRLDGQSLTGWARANGVPGGAARMRRLRAERRLVEWIARKSA